MDTDVHGEEIVTEQTQATVMEDDDEVSNPDNYNIENSSELQNIESTEVKQTKKSICSKDKKKKKKLHKHDKKSAEIITDADFGPEVDYSKASGFVYDPKKAEFQDDEIKLVKRPWEIQDVKSIAYLHRLERKHEKLVHGLASVRKLTPKQILKEEIREIVKYNEEVRQEKEKENIKNKIWEVVDDEIPFKQDDYPELEDRLLEAEDSIQI